MINPYNLTTLYVSQKYGSNRKTGFSKNTNDPQNGPLQTIEKALDKIKEMRFFGCLQPVTIKVLDEEYSVTKPIIIDNEVFGVTIEPYTKTLISGGIQIKDLKKDTFNNTECFSAYVPEVAENGLWFTDLYVDSEHAQFTRYPKDGTLTPESVDNNDKALYTHSKWFIADKKDLEVIKSFKNFNDCFISYNHYWIDEHTPIESYDTKTGKIVCKYYSRFSVSSLYPASAMHYIIENVAEAFSNPNEWYLDRETSKVYYIPRNENQTPENITVYAPVTDKLFIIQGTSEKPTQNIYINGFEFAYTKGDYESKATTENAPAKIEGEEVSYASDSQAVASAHGSIELEFAHNCIIENCNIHSLGVHAIAMKAGVQNVKIINNDISDMGAGGINSGGEAYGSEKAYHNCNNTISNNTIHGLGKRYFAACGVLVKHSYNNLISHNDIFDLYYTGISVGWVWGYTDNLSNNNIIEYNHIYDLGKGKLSDMGGIYLLGKQQGTIVRNNLIHDVVSAHYGGWGLYTDEGSSYITLENNICYNLHCNCYHQHFGCMNTARNNIFVLAKEEPVKVTRSEMHTGMIFEKNIIVANNTALFGLNPDGIGSGGIPTIISHDNIIFDTENVDPMFLSIGDDKFTVSEAREKLSIDDGSIIADPKFKGIDTHDFTLSPDSPAFELGFKPIDTKNIGVIR